MTDAYDIIVQHLHLHEATKVLDLGSGDGELGRRLRENGFVGAYRGVDRDPTAIANLKDQHFQAEEGDLRWLDYRKNTWDCVVMKDVLEHLDNISTMVEGILIARRVFILATQAVITDSISPAPRGVIHFNVDDLFSMARAGSFQYHDYARCNDHTILIFTRKKKS